jgi:hypothetical protein
VHPAVEVAELVEVTGPFDELRDLLGDRGPVDAGDKARFASAAHSRRKRMNRAAVKVVSLP